METANVAVVETVRPTEQIFQKIMFPKSLPEARRISEPGEHSSPQPRYYEEVVVGDRDVGAWFFHFSARPEARAVGRRPKPETLYISSFGGVIQNPALL